MFDVERLNIRGFWAHKKSATDERGAAVTATEVTYGAYDRFYLATGKYHLFNTCVAVSLITTLILIGAHRCHPW